MSEFQVGDRVKLVDVDGPYEIPNGSLGTVTDVGDRHESGLIGVDFDGGFDTLGGRMFEWRFEKVVAPKFKVGDRVRTKKYWYGTGTVTDAFSGYFDGHYEVKMDEGQGPYGYSVGAFEAKNLEKLPEPLPALSAGDIVNGAHFIDMILDGTVVRDADDFFVYVEDGVGRAFGDASDYELSELAHPLTIVAVDV